MNNTDERCGSYPLLILPAQNSAMMINRLHPRPHAFACQSFSLFLCWCLPFRLGRPYHAALLHIIILVHLHRTSIANEFPRHVLVELLHTMLCELCLCQPRDETSVAAPLLAHTANTENESALIVLFVLLCTTSCARHLCQEPREISASSAAVVAATPVPSALAVALQTHRRL